MGKFIDWKKADEMASGILKTLDLDYDLHEKIENMSVANQQMMEIAKAVSEKNTKNYYYGRANSFYYKAETDKLFEHIHKLKQQGVAIIYISHRLEEIKRIGDRIVVMRDGGYVGERMVTDNINLDEVIHLMVGREVTQYYPKSEHHIGEVSMEIKISVFQSWYMT